MQLYNTRTRRIEEFVPIKAGHVGMYACGPTVYHYAHIGNLRAYMVWDILRRVLVLNGFSVRYVMNITDVGHLTDDADSGDDKMEKGAARENMSVWDVARMYTDAFLADCVKLSILPPTVLCKATEHILEQIDQIKLLEKKGFTYRIEDGIYYDTSKFAAYADFAKLNLAEQAAGIRVELAAGKRNPTDFALWKFARVKRQMQWPSPWGEGFPGWHIECSAMSMKYLDGHFDIHCGGIDHISVHHTNEIAQATPLLNDSKPWVNYWLHNNFIVLGDSLKMAKSGEGFITLQVLLDKGFDAMSYRYMCLTTNYRKQLAFTYESLEGAQNSLRSVKEKIANLTGSLVEGVHAYEEEFTVAINDDLNTPVALAVMHAVIGDMTISVTQKRGLLAKFDEVFGLDLLRPTTVDIPVAIQSLLDLRAKARLAKDFKLSDTLRDQIAAQGYTLKDQKDGSQKVFKS